MSRLVSELGADVIDDTQVEKKHKIDPHKRNNIVGFSILGVLAMLIGFVYYMAVNVWLYDYQNMPYLEYTINQLEDTDGPYAGQRTAAISRVISNSNYPSVFNVPEKINGYVITRIEDQAFAGCDRLTEVHMKDNICSLGNEVFLHCPKLKTIKFSKNITKIGDDCFEDTIFQDNLANYEYYTVNNILLYVNEEKLLDHYNKTKLALVSSSESTYKDSFDANTLVYSLSDLVDAKSNATSSLHLDTWMNGLFKNFQSIIFVETPSYLTAVTERAFYNCRRIENAVINGTSIYPEAFSGCSSLASVSLNSQITSIGAKAFYGTAISSITLHEGISTLGSGVFSNCQNLTSISVPSSVSVIPEEFVKNTPVASVSFTNIDKIVDVGPGAFSGTNLTSFTFPKNVDSIPDNCFAECTSLEYVSVYDNYVKNINAYAFSNDTSFTKMVTLADDGTVLHDVNNTLYLPSALETTNLTLGIQEGYCFANTKIKEVVFSKNIRYIGSFIFQNCELLDTVTWVSISETKCRMVGEGAFEGCTALTSISLPNLVRYIGLYAFRNCTSLTSIHLPEAKEWTTFEYNIASNYGASTPSYYVSISEYLFYGCTSLVTLDIPSTVTRIASYAFANCTSLEFLHISSGVSNVGRNAFEGDSKLYLSLEHSIVPDSSRYYPGWNNGVKGYALGSKSIFTDNGIVYSVNNDDETLTVVDVINTSITSLVIPSTVDGKKVTCINDNFLNTSETLTSVTLPDTLTDVGSGAFQNCPNLVFTSENGFYYLGNSTNTHVAIIKSDTSEHQSGEEPSFILNENVEVISIDALNNNKINYEEEVDGNNIVAKYLKTSSNDKFALVSIGNTVTETSIDSNVRLIAKHAISENARIKSVIIPDTVSYVMKAALYSNRNVSIYSKSLSRPNGWDYDWNISNSPAYWGTIGGCDVPNRYKACINLDGTIRLTSLLDPDTRITLPSEIDGRDVTEIASNFVTDNSVVTALTIPSSITKINANAFVSMPRATIYAEAASKPAGWDSNWNPSELPVYYGVSSNTVVTSGGVDYVITGSTVTVAGYSSSAGQVYIKDRVEIGGQAYDVTMIGPKAFQGSKISYITIPSSVTTIGEHAFRDCDNLVIYLQSESIPEGFDPNFNSDNRPLYLGVGSSNIKVTSTGLVLHQVSDYAVVSGHTSDVTEAVVPLLETVNGSQLAVKKIMPHALENATYLSSITFETSDNGSNINEIGSYAFKGTTALVRIVIPSSVETMGEKVFYLSRSSLQVFVTSKIIPSGWNQDWDVYESFNSSEEDEDTRVNAYIGLDVAWEYNKDSGLPTPIV